MQSSRVSAFSPSTARSNLDSSLFQFCLFQQSFPVKVVKMYVSELTMNTSMTWTNIVKKGQDSSTVTWALITWTQFFSRLQRVLWRLFSRLQRRLYTTAAVVFSPRCCCFALTSAALSLVKQLFHHTMNFFPSWIRSPAASEFFFSLPDSWMSWLHFKLLQCLWMAVVCQRSSWLDGRGDLRSDTSVRAFKIHF